MNKYLAETIATFFLLLIGTGSVIINHLSSGAITLAGISIITGLIVSIMIVVFGKHSGAHMNPVVTFVAFLNGEMKMNEFFAYVFFQAIGAFMGTFVLSVIFSNSTTLGETVPSINYISAFIIEIIITFCLVMVVLYTPTSFPKLAPWLIGGFVAVGIFFAGNYSGGSMNPIRSLSPAVLNSNTKVIWLFLTAPFIGGILAFITFKKFKK